MEVCPRRRLDRREDRIEEKIGLGRRLDCGEDWKIGLRRRLE